MSLQRRERQKERIVTKAAKTPDDIVPDGQMLTKAELAVFKELAGRIRDDAHLAGILQSVTFDRREVIYEQIAPHLAFKAKPFHELKFW